MRNAETIFAVASGSGKSAIKVLRVSGPGARSVADGLGLGVLPPRAAALRKILHPHSKEQIDRGLALWFSAPHSYTGEDSLEIHFHGGRAVQAALFNALTLIPGCRMADPGEFTWRAFANGKMDLTAVEGLSDLIEAETESQRRQALGQVEGRLLRHAEAWREKLIACLGFIESAIDFEDEADVPQEVRGAVQSLARDVLADLEAALGDERRGEITREGLTVVIAGPPNAGKSSLLNYLAGREVAIVASSPGTTRDAIEVALDLDGAAVMLIDTAGLRETDDPVEAMGVARTKARAQQADVILWLSSNPRAAAPDFGDQMQGKLISLRSKADICDDDGVGLLSISSLTGYGMKELLDLLATKAAVLMGSREPALITRGRHRSAIASAAERLRNLDVHNRGLECTAEDVQQAARDLGDLFGRVDTEEVLGEIFSRFCIGK